MSTDDSGSTSPFARRGFIAAAVVVGVIAALGIFVLVMNLVSPPTSAPPTDSPTSTPPVSAADASVCGLEAFETESSLTQAPDVEWELVGTIAAPTDPAVGPGTVDDGFRSCFAHTAEGALYAAVNFLATGTDAMLSQRLLELVAEGPGKDALEQLLSQSPDGVTSSYRAQVAGYKIGQYDGTNATIDLVLNYSDGRLVSVPLRLVWEDGDWKAVFDDTGQMPLAPAELQNLGGYTPWGGA
ncbi:hypothetical protein [Leucobacter sp. wl10]|uniref:hypothetical protein n=1 Tax=Leucobacter sp. wl10 TaxID=2304677 RepID=UPI000E5ABBB0|nr:hypothetical protein [Leucobacter sp. wl10]RGE19089.1 hypothetical protein D1J51_13290 [Leucobacter sp. wl10]